MKIVEYDRKKAVAYAHKWAYERNPAFYDYQDIGGDCTNFASQCVYAGSGVMNFTPVMGWYYRDANDKAPAWSGVPYFYNFMVNNAGIGPFARETALREALAGDACQLSFDGVLWRHTPFIIAVGNPPSGDNILLAAHSMNTDNRPLSSYSYAKYRIIHIEGVRIE